MKKILSIFLVITMLLSMLVAAVPAVAVEATGAAALDQNKVGNVVVTDENRAEYVEKLRSEGYKELDDAQMYAGLETGGKYFLLKDFDLTGRATEFNLPLKNGEDTREEIGLGNSAYVIGNVVIDGCGYSLTVDTPLFMYSANITLKNITFKGTIDSYKISPDGGAFSVLTLWSHWGYCNMENVTSEVTVTTTNHSIEGRDNGSQKLTALTIDATDSTFKNVKVVGNHIAEEVSDHLVAVGAIAGITYGTCVFEDCVSVGNTVIKSKAMKNTNGIGGMVGYAKGNIEFKNCYNSRALTLESATVMNCVTNVGGFVGKVDGYANFENCTNDNIMVVNGSVTGNESALGGFVGYVDGKVTAENCVNNGKITFGAKTAYQGEDGTVNRESYFGGFIGRAAGGVDMSDCEMNAALTLNSTSTGFGGFAGFLEKENSCSFKSCVNNGTLTFASGATLAQPKDIGMGIGGLVGMSKCDSLVFEDCANMNPITFTIASSQGACGVGGILGYQYITDATLLSFNKCVNYGDITDNGDYNPSMGGICGAARGVKDVAFIECVNEGDVKHTKQASGGWAYAGGIIGMYGDCGNWMSTDKSAPTTLDVFSCVNNGNVTATTHAGGILGSNNEIDHQYNTMTFYSCHNTGDVKSSNNKGKAAGIVGEAYGRGNISIGNSVNEGNVSGKHAGGILSAAANTDRTFVNADISSCKNIGDITAIVSGGGIAANLLSTVVLTIDSCHNSGSVTVNGSEEDKDPIAGGILGYTTKVAVNVKNNVNSGTISCAVNTSESAITHSRVMLSEGCVNYYLSGCVSGGTTAHGTAKSESELSSIVSAMKFLKQSNAYYLNKSITSASTLIASDYTEATWVNVAAAIASAKAAMDDFSATQAKVDGEKEKLDSAVAALAIKEIDYTKYEEALAEYKALDRNDWNSTTWLELELAIEAVEDLKADENSLQSQVDAAVENIGYRISKLEEKVINGGIDVENNSQLNTGGTLRPVDPTGTSTESSTDAPTDTSTETSTEPASEGGCGGIIGGAAVVLVAVAAIGVGISFRKKED